MKNVLRIIILTIITSFIFSSCSNKLSITKRKYNKGYYVSHSHKKHNVKDQQAPTSVKPEINEAAEAIVVKPKTQITAEDKNAPLLSASVSKPTENSSSVKNSAKTTSAPALNKKHYKVKQLEKLMPSKFYTQEIKNKLSARSDGEALSLLWIIIVVVLLLYLLGLLFGGFGLGGAIHVLAVIFLVLLILWLLRII
ncbi:MAG: hypothetical protein H0W73_17150 [Bacteroidetes bacterium]|nr:hypothetical protein [Bacteroidota bacterium]